MKSNTFVFLPKESPPATVLQRLKLSNSAMNISDFEGMIYVKCEIESSDGYYISLKVHHPLPGHPQSNYKALIPHAFVLLVLNTDQKTELGFSPGS